MEFNLIDTKTSAILLVEKLEEELIYYISDNGFEGFSKEEEIELEKEFEKVLYNFYKKHKYNHLGILL